MKKTKILFSFITALAPSIPLLVLTSCGSNGSIKADSFDVTCEGEVGRYSFKYTGTKPDDNVLNVSIFKLDQPEPPENLALVTNQIDLSNTGTNFTIDVRVIKNLYKTNTTSFNFVFTWIEGGEQKISDFKKTFNLTYDTILGHDIALESNKILPVEEDVANFSFYLHAPVVQNHFFAHIIQDSKNPKLQFVGSESFDSEFDITDTEHVFSLPIKFINPQAETNMVNFGIEFRYLDINHSEYIVEKVSGLGILPKLNIGENIEFESDQDVEVGVDNLTAFKFKWTNQTLPKNEKVSLRIDGDDNIVFDDKKTSKEITVAVGQENEIKLGFISFAIERSRSFNLKFTYELGDNSMCEGVTINLAPCETFIQVESTEYSAMDEEEKSTLQFKWLGDEGLFPESNIVHLAIPQETIKGSNIAFINQDGDFVDEIDVVFNGPTYNVQIGFKNKEYYLESTTFNVVSTYTISGRKIEQTFSNLVLKPYAFDNWLNFSNFTEFSETNHNEETTITWVPKYKQLVSNNVKLTILDNNDYLCFEGAKPEQEIILTESQGIKSATATFFNRYEFTGEKKVKIRLTFNVATSESTSKEVSKDIEYKIMPMKQYCSFQPNIYFDKDPSYGFGDICFEWKDSQQPIGDNLTFVLPEDSIYSFDSEISKKQTTVSVGTKHLPIYLLEGQTFVKGPIDISYKFSVNNEDYFRLMKLTVIDFREEESLHLFNDWRDEVESVQESWVSTEIEHSVTWPTTMLLDTSTEATLTITWQAEKIEDDIMIDIMKDPSIASGATFTPTQCGDKWTIKINSGFYILRYRGELDDKFTGEHIGEVKYQIRGKEFTETFKWHISYCVIKQKDPS